MNMFKKYNPWILEQDACFIRVTILATKSNFQLKFWWNCGKKLTLVNPGDNYNVCARY